MIETQFDTQRRLERAVHRYVEAIFWYVIIAVLAVALLAAFRALVEEYVFRAQVELPKQLNDLETPDLERVDAPSMKDVREHRRAYRRALAGGLSAAADSLPVARPPSPAKPPPRDDDDD